MVSQSCAKTLNEFFSKLSWAEIRKYLASIRLMLDPKIAAVNVDELLEGHALFLEHSREILAACHHSPCRAGR